MTSLTESKTARISTLCALYFAQGFPWGFMTTALDIQAHLGAPHRLLQLPCHGPPPSLDYLC